VLNFPIKCFEANKIKCIATERLECSAQSAAGVCIPAYIEKKGEGLKYLSHVGSVGAMCRCLKDVPSVKVTLFDVFGGLYDLADIDKRTCCEKVPVLIFCMTCIPCMACLVAGLEAIIQNGLEDACCPDNRCCSKCLSDHCYEEPDQATQAKSAAFTARVTASDVAPLLVNQL